MTKDCHGFHGAKEFQKPVGFWNVVNGEGSLGHDSTVKIGSRASI
jgi:hypothetical protein